MISLVNSRKLHFPAVCNALRILVHLDILCSSWSSPHKCGKNRSTGYIILEGMHIAHGQFITRCQRIGKAQGHMVLDHTRSQNVESHISCLDWIITMIVASTQRHLLTVLVFNTQFPYVNVAPAKTRAIIGAKLRHISTGVGKKKNKKEND